MLDLSKFDIYDRGVSLKLGGLTHDVFIDKVGGPRHHYYGQTEKYLVKYLGPRHITHKVEHKVVNIQKEKHEAYEGNYPMELTNNPSAKYMIPASSYSDTAIDVKKLFVELEIFVSPKDSFYY